MDHAAWLGFVRMAAMISLGIATLRSAWKARQRRGDVSVLTKTS